MSSSTHSEHLCVCVCVYVCVCEGGGCCQTDKLRFE
jgi:hypothetical protein